MTPTEAFEAWWKETKTDYWSRIFTEMAKKSWLAACAWQREQDAKVAEQHGP